MSTLFDVDPITYDDLASVTHCRDCGRTLAGRWARCWQGCTDGVFWGVCDDCNPLGGHA